VSEKKKGSAVAKMGLVVILLGAIGYFGYTRLDANGQSVKEQDELVINTSNAMGEAMGSADPNGKDNTVGLWRSRLETAIKLEGGLTGTFKFVATDDLKKGAARSVLIATAMLPLASLMEGKVEQADAECKAYRAKRAATPGDFQNLDAAEKRVASIEKFCAGSKDKKLEPKVVWGTYRTAAIIEALTDKLTDKK